MAPYYPDGGGSTQFGSSCSFINAKPIRAKMVVLRGLGNRNRQGNVGPHPGGGATVWLGRKFRQGVAPLVYQNTKGRGNWGFGPEAQSVDQFLSTPFRGKLPFADIRAGWGNTVGKDGNIDKSISIEKGDVVPRYQTAVALFNDVFANVAARAGGGTGGATSMQASEFVRRRRSVLDYVSGHVSALGARVSTFDKAKIDAHLTAIRELEESFRASGMVQASASCSKPAAPATGNLSNNTDAYASLIAMAFACGLTRVAGGGFGRHINGESHSFLPHGDSNWHAATHGTGFQAYYDEMIAFRFGSFVKLLERLDSYTDNDGRTILDNTLCMFTQDQGNGHSSADHGIILGGATGALSGGQSFRLTGGTNQVLSSVVRYMGHDLNFGEPGLAEGSLPGNVLRL
jgi:hypothetical protein